MPFKYINPGYWKLYSPTGGRQYSGVNYNPINGVYLGDTCKGYILFPSECEEIWAKTGVTLYGTGNFGEFGIGVVSSESHYNERKSSETLYGFRVVGGVIYAYIGTARTQAISGTWVTQQYHNLLLHSRNGENGLLELFIDGKLVHSYEGNVSWGAHQITFRNNNGQTCFSNTIVSDTLITPSEEVYIVSPSTTEATMTESDGVYTATEANQTFKQGIDVSALISKIGSSNIKITGTGVIARDALFDGEGLTKIASMRDDVEKQEFVLTDVAYDVVSAWGEDLTLAGLAALKVGWKTKA